jgi:hypothetical protein
MVKLSTLGLCKENCYLRPMTKACSDYMHILRATLENPNYSVAEEYGQSK